MVIIRLVAVVIADLIAAGASAQRLITGDAAVGAARFAPTRSAPSCWPRSLPCSLLAAVDSQLTAGAAGGPTAAHACTKR